MEYTKTVWKDLPDTSTPITADKLNNLEDGVEYLFENGTGGGDNLPVGVEMDFDGVSQDIPTGWEEITNPDSYSTSEVKTNKVWIDNKSIYRKVLTGTLPTGSGENVFTITNAKIINFNGIIKSTYNQWWTLPSIYSDDNYGIYTYISGDRTQLKVDCGSYFSTNSQYEIIIEYTKTTD